MPGSDETVEGRRPRVLVLLLEFPRWEHARSWSYTGSYALLDGLAANGVETFVIPGYGYLDSRSPDTWLSRARSLCRGHSFDQVWMWLVHVPFDAFFLEWVAGVAPVRVGFICESLLYEPQAYAEFPHLARRRTLVLQQLQSVTHAVAVDEVDVDFLNEMGSVRAVWWPSCVPRRFVAEGCSPPAHRTAAFYGAVYGERARILASEDLQGLLVYPPPPEKDTRLPGLFDELHRLAREQLRCGAGVRNGEVLSRYVEALHTIRGEMFSLWLESLRRWNAVVNLPSYVRSYAGRVVEAMAAGRPVISWEVPGRPRNRALFEEGREILLYKRDAPARLAEHIRALQRDASLGQMIAERAREKVLRYHTAETRVRQILDWIDTGKEPDYGEVAGGVRAR